MKVIWWMYTIYATICFVFWMLVFGLGIVVPLLVSPRGGKVSFIFIRLWARTWSAMVGIRYEVHGREHVASEKAYIFIFNHRSFIDAPVIPMGIQQEVRAIGKKELARIPVFGFIVSRVAVWVDRDSPESRKISVEKLLQVLQRGISIVVAPEGTRNDTNQTLLPFQKGAFRMAIETGVSILPMAVIGADHIMRRGSMMMRPGKVRVYFSSPIDPTPYQANNNFEGLAEKCYNRLESMIMVNE